MPLIIHVDGGSRGNPGPAGAGVSIRDEAGRALFEAGFYLGVMTNNSAEYNGLIRALDAATAWPDAELIIRSDSELMVRQITGQYKVRNPDLAGLYREVQVRLLKRDHWSIRHVMREANTRADELANLAMDAGEDVIETDRRGTAATDGGGGADGRANGSGSTKAGSPSAAPGGAGKTKRAGPPAAPADVDDLDDSTGRGSDAVRAEAAGVEATCVAGSAPRVCPAPCRPGDTFIFDRCGPADLCLDALAAMLTTAIVLRDTAAAGGASMPALTVRCARAACGGAFELRGGIDG